MRKRVLSAAAALLAVTMMMSACSSAKANDGSKADTTESSAAVSKEPSYDYDFTVDMSGYDIGQVSSGTSVHDPSILKADGKYYIYGSHMAAASCDDLLSWKFMANGYRADNSVFGQIYSVYDEAFAYAGAPSSLIPTDDAGRGGEHVWAPDVIYNKAMGKYVMYYCTTSTWNASNLCYGISDTPEGPFEWQGALVYSGFDMSNIEATDVYDYVDEDYAVENYIKGGKYNFDDCPNAIDPAIFYDGEGKMWLVYGSWSGGIFLLEVDEATGRVIHPEADPDNNVDPYFGRKLAGGGHESMEAPYILWDEDSGYYYLFVSYGGLNREGGYQIRVFRSDKPDGKYVDMYDRELEAKVNNSYFGLKLSGNYMLPSLKQAYMATGHNSALVDDDGKKYVVYHTRFDNGSEAHSPRVHQFIVNAEGWPCMLPYQTQGETVSEKGYSMDDVAGRYYFINQGTEISADIAEPVILYLDPNGNAVTEKETGTWEMTEGSCYMTVTLGETTYSGVFCAMMDEADTQVMTFSAVGNNESVWGVKYAE